MDKEKNNSTEKKQDLKETAENLTKSQVIFYSLIIAGSIAIMILSMIGINLLFLIIVIAVTLIYVYFEKDLESDDITESLNVNSEKNSE